MPLDPLAIAALGAVLLTAIREVWLIKQNRRKVIAEGAREAADSLNLTTQAADTMLRNLLQDNQRLREQVETLEAKEQLMEKRIEILEDLLRAHGVVVPRVDEEGAA